MRWIEGNLLALCLALVAPCFGQNVPTASIKRLEDLASLIKSRGCLDSLEFRNQRIQPDVRINGTEVMKCKGGSCIVGTSLVPPPYFCSAATNVTLYPGNPPSPQNFTGSELCTRFPHVEPTRESEENNNNCLYVHLAYIIFIIIFTVFWAVIILGICKRMSHTKEKDETCNAELGAYQQPWRNTCFKKLTELINEVACSTTPSGHWQCLCEKQCFLLKPNSFNYDGKSYAIFVVKNKSERSNCIDPHLEKYQQNFHVANVFVVYMDDVDAATSADHLQVWYKESCKWDHSLLKDKVFLHMSVSQPSPSGNSASSVMDNGGAIRKLTEVPEEQDKVLTDPLVENMLSRQQTARFSDYHVSEENVQKTVDAVTGEGPDKTATVLGNTLIRRNPSSRSMARSDGGEFRENTTSQDDTPKFFTGERAEFKEIDNEDTES